LNSEKLVGKKNGRVINSEKSKKKLYLIGGYKFNFNMFLNKNIQR
jgi:hypothetical protein